MPMPLAMYTVLARYIVIVVAVRHITTRLIVKVAGIVVPRASIVSATPATSPVAAPMSATVMVMMSMAVMPGTDDVVGFAFF